MAANSNIEWTDSTVNFWWGCTKVGPGCDHCYAETWAKRTGGNIWGTGVPRRKIKSAGALLHRLDNDYSWWAADHAIAGHHQTSRRRVFIQSMSDLFDLEVPVEWFAEAWQTIERCSRLHIQIVTKRISAVEKRRAAIGVPTWPKHAGLIITVCNQAEADRDIPRLLALKAKLGIPWVGLSMEPLLGAVVLKPEWLAEINWVIVGGESGPGARPMHPDLVRSLRDQCAAADVSFFFKQWGEWVSALQIAGATAISAAPPASGRYAHPHRRRVHGGPLEGQCFEGLPEDHHILKVGKKAAGRLLDGIEHNGMPRAFT